MRLIPFVYIDFTHLYKPFESLDNKFYTKEHDIMKKQTSRNLVTIIYQSIFHMLTFDMSSAAICKILASLILFP